MADGIHIPDSAIPKEVVLAVKSILKISFLSTRGRPSDEEFEVIARVASKAVLKTWPDADFGSDDGGKSFCEAILTFPESKA